jgi:hypothetical protein
MQPYQPQPYQPQPYQPGPSWPPPAYPPGPASAPPGPARRKGGGRTALIIVVVLLVVCGGGPTAALGIRYATAETGPHQTLPNACTAMDGQAFHENVEKAQRPNRVGPTDTGSTLSDGCVWRVADPAKDVQLEVSATLYRRTIWSSSVGNASGKYNNMSKLEDNKVHDAYLSNRPAEFSIKLSGAGDDGFCWAADDKGVADFGCVVRAGNVLLTVTIKPPNPGDRRAIVDTEITSDVQQGETGGRELVNDFLQNLT